jgi:hypothetical protein
MAAASGQGSVKVASGQVYALHPKRPLTRLARDCDIAALSPRTERVPHLWLNTAGAQAGNIALSLGAERVPHLWLDTGGRPESIALSPGERVSRSGASSSRSGTGEGSLAHFREPTSSVAPRSSPAVQSNSTPQPGFAGEASGEPLPSASGRATRRMSRFELRFGCAARGGPHGQRETIADAEL